MPKSTACLGIILAVLCAPPVNAATSVSIVVKPHAVVIAGKRYPKGSCYSVGPGSVGVLVTAYPGAQEVALRFSYGNDYMDVRVFLRDARRVDCP